MKLFELLKVWEPTFEATKAKVHLARYNGNERPLDVFLEGQFDEWQRWQSKRNFQREFVVSLVSAGSPSRWLYAGLFRSFDCVEEADPKPHFYYTLERVPSCEEWVGRLVCVRRRHLESRVDPTSLLDVGLKKIPLKARCAVSRCCFSPAVAAAACRCRGPAWWAAWPACRSARRADRCRWPWRWPAGS